MWLLFLLLGEEIEKMKKNEKGVAAIFIGAQLAILFATMLP
jgi:hypothetical protein